MIQAIENLFFRSLALIFFIFSLPFFVVLYFIIEISSKGPFLFTQKRVGKDKKGFTIYKIRTMVHNAEKLKKKYLNLNETDGTVFKIYHDPRYTKIGKFLSHTGLDELPQLINIIKGDMSFVGPRPLPIDEALKIPKKYEARFSVLPGLTSPWTIKGAHKLSFKQWMELDLRYVKKHNLWYDIIVLLTTIKLVTKLILFKLISYEKV